MGIKWIGIYFNKFKPRLSATFLIFATLRDKQSKCCESTPIYGICKECMVWKIHILTFLFYLPLLSTGLLMRRICIYGRYDEKVGQITTGRPCIAFFCDCATRSQLSFLNSLITRAPSSEHCSSKRGYCISGNCHVGLIFAEFATSLKLQKNRHSKKYTLLLVSMTSI